MTQTNDSFIMPHNLFLAQDGVLGTGQPASGTPVASGGVAGTDAAPRQGGIMDFFPLILLGLFGFMILSMTLNGRKDKKKRAAMLAAVGKRDRVKTIGGVIGTVIEVKKDEMLIESDRASNTRLWVTRGSVQTVLNSTSADGVDETTSETVSA